MLSLFYYNFVNYSIVKCYFLKIHFFAQISFCKIRDTTFSRLERLYLVHQWFEKAILDLAHTHTTNTVERAGVDFINIQRTAFTHADPECAKKTVMSAVLFGAFGIYERKSCM